MSGDIADVELTPFMHACAAIVRELGPDAPELLEDLPGAVAAIVKERNRLRRSFAAKLLLERDRMRSALLDILVVESLDSAHLLAKGVLDRVTSELDEIEEGL